MAWYRTGTVSVTNGSPNVTGSGTAFVGNILAGWAFYGPDGRLYEVLTVVSNTAIVLATNYLGTNQSGQAYSIFPTRSTELRLATSVQALITDYQAVADNAGAGKFAAGTVDSPGVRFVVDEDTGVRRSASNTIALVAGGADQLILTGGVATGNAVQSSVTDAVVGKLLRVGAFGLGTTDPSVLANLDAANTPTGIYAINNTTTGTRPAGIGASEWGLVLNFGRSSASGYVTQWCWSVNQSEPTIYARKYDAAASPQWEPWRLKSGWENYTIADNGVAIFRPPRKAGFMYLTYGGLLDSPNSAYSCPLFYDVGTTPLITKLSSAIGASLTAVVGGTGLTGTTGADGSMSVAGHANELYIENRLGFSITVQVEYGGS